MTAKTPLILVPGLLCDAALYAPQTAALSDIADITVADVAQDDSLGGMGRPPAGRRPGHLRPRRAEHGGLCGAGSDAPGPRTG